MLKTRFIRPLTLHLRTKVSAFSRTCSVSPMIRRVGRSYKSELDLAACRRREASFSVFDLRSRHSCLKDELPSSAALLTWSASWIDGKIVSEVVILQDDREIGCAVLMRVELCEIVLYCWCGRE
ncbi:hypothetical protein MtrunA17_Chr8g0371881 [Medicago truncatula]|uniref:Uncharacterized protein n=1 Tax=Medicago truncatula TaxID=3880 RepID=A0A396GLS1_MEDTR|nr:hypothetical protein MtrunA17_Chr8g0371881 [Medicago truncatula]